MSHNSGQFKPIPVGERFWSKVFKTRNCWLWTAKLDVGGYGIIKSEGKNRKAHRISYEMAFGKIPDGRIVCHRCDNPKCVNPRHLFIGSHMDNRRDCVSKKRQAVGTAVTISKLTPAKVRAIRKQFARGIRITPLARRYGVTFRSIKLVVDRVTWSHVA